MQTITWSLFVSIGHFAPVSFNVIFMVKHKLGGKKIKKPMAVKFESEPGIEIDQVWSHSRRKKSSIRDNSPMALLFRRKTP